eukprot:1157442-Pelagomonas_calceolata.AAC.10
MACCAVLPGGDRHAQPCAETPACCSTSPRSANTASTSSKRSARACAGGHAARPDNASISFRGC